MMRTIYSNSIKGFKIIKSYPNPVFYAIELNGELCRLHIRDKEGKIVYFKKLDEIESAWYCPQIKSDKIIMLSCEWFPKELIAGVLNGRYDVNTDLSRATGWVQSFNTGSNSECFRESKVHEAIYILEKNGFELKTQ